MTHQHELRDANRARDPGGAEPARSPGKTSATARLPARSQVVFRVDSAEAAAVFADRFGPRDDNGVAADAAPVVQRAAAGSTGAPLPTVARARFERSLGADLSAVRVHTGPASAEAAGALGARAYTTGQDIHFGAGQFAPDDPFGLHLLAHEVAHTQQGGRGAQPACKLSVSSPGNALEHEADRAADAMVQGAAVEIGAGTGAALARKAPPLTGGPPPAPTYHDAKIAGPNFDKTINWEHPPQFYGLAGDKARTLRAQYRDHLMRHLAGERKLHELAVGFDAAAIARRIEQIADESMPLKVGEDEKSGAADARPYRKALWRSSQRALVDTLSVETSNDRYKKNGSTTYCNVYGTDMVNAMGGYLPRVWYNDLGNSTKLSKAFLEAKVTKSELSANLIGAWLNKWGADFGWVRTADAEAAQKAANSGRVVIIQASKADGVSAGHVNVILAEGDDHHATKSASGKVQPLQSQAGDSNFEYSDTTNDTANKGIGDNWWKAPDMKDEPEGNFWIYKGVHQGDHAVASAAELGKQE